MLPELSASVDAQSIQPFHFDDYVEAPDKVLTYGVDPPGVEEVMARPLSDPFGLERLPEYNQSSATSGYEYPIEGLEGQCSPNVFAYAANNTLDNNIGTPYLQDKNNCILPTVDNPTSLARSFASTSALGSALSSTTSTFHSTLAASLQTSATPTTSPSSLLPCPALPTFDLGTDTADILEPDEIKELQRLLAMENPNKKQRARIAKLQHPTLNRNGVRRKKWTQQQDPATSRKSYTKIDKQGEQRLAKKTALVEANDTDEEQPVHEQQILIEHETPVTKERYSSKKRDDCQTNQAAAQKKKMKLNQASSTTVSPNKVYKNKRSATEMNDESDESEEDILPTKQQRTGGKHAEYAYLRKPVFHRRKKVIDEEPINDKDYKCVPPPGYTCIPPGYIKVYSKEQDKMILAREEGDPAYYSAREQQEVMGYNRFDVNGHYTPQMNAAISNPATPYPPTQTQQNEFFNWKIGQWLPDFAYE